MHPSAWARVLLGKAWRAHRRTRTHWERHLDDHRSSPEGYRSVHVGGRARHGRVVDRYDSVAAGKEATTVLCQALTVAGANYTLLPRPQVGAASIAVSEDDATALHAAMKTVAADGHEWLFRTDGSRRDHYRHLREWGKPRVTAPARYRVLRLLVAGSGLVLSSMEDEVVIELWSSASESGVMCEGGELHSAGSLIAPAPVASIPCLTRTAWAEATSSGGGSDHPLCQPHLLDVTDPIDAVYTWVDGGDPNWIRRRDDALHREPTERHHTATSKSRYISRDELRYSLRSLEMYASWVRRIHLVTDGQVPEWLDTDHPKINLVDHREIFSDTSVLPVFNSHAIESQLHHIPGLSDRYLYINDDVFFGRPVRPELFFEGNGVTRFFTAAYALGTAPSTENDAPALAAGKNNRAFMQRHFNRTVTKRFRHTPHPQNRLVLTEMEERYPELFTRVSGSSFRASHDYSIAASLHHYYAYATGRAVPGTLRALYRDLSQLTSSRDLERVFAPPGHDVFCLNDVHLTTQTKENRVVEIVREFWEEHFPLPSSFER